MAESDASHIVPSTDVICQELDGEIVILDLQQEQYFGLNETATRMWQLMSEGKTADQIVDTMLNEFEVDAVTLQRDLETLVQQLSNVSLATVSG